MPMMPASWPGARSCAQAQENLRPRQADAEFQRALLHGISHETVEAYRRQQDREESMDAQQQRIELIAGG